jgi:hypothetical protein
MLDKFIGNFVAAANVKSQLCNHLIEISLDKSYGYHISSEDVNKLWLALKNEYSELVTELSKRFLLL